MATRRRLGRRLLTKKAIQFEGIDQLAATANALARAGGYQGGEIAKEYKQGLMAGALIVRDEAESMAPVDTGLLRDWIFAAYGDPKKPDVLVGVNTRKVVRTTLSGETRTYAGVVEYGDDEHAPQPYMRPAINATRPLVARIVKERLSDAVEKLATKLRK